MKNRTHKGMGVVKHSTPISFKMEDQMWKARVLGEDTPDKLVETVLFLIGVNFALRGGEEHKRPRRPGCNLQIVNHVDEDGYECLKFTDDPYSKTNQGGLSKPLPDPKVVYCYRNKDESRCLYRLYNKYTSLLPKTLKATCLYLRSKHWVLPNQLYIDSNLGINSIYPIFNRLAEVAGLPKGHYKNHSGRASSCTCVFRDTLDKQVICHVSGHRSNAVRIYKHLTDDVRRAASESIQGKIAPLTSVVATNQCKPNDKVAPSTISKADSESDLDDFVTKDLKEIQTPLKRKLILKESVSEVGNICDMITKVASEKKYKKIHLNVEFSDDSIFCMCLIKMEKNDQNCVFEVI